MHRQRRTRLGLRLRVFLPLTVAALVVIRASTASDEPPRLVKDINDTFNFAASAEPGRVVEANGIGFLIVDDGVNGRELWRTDGTSSGTMMIEDIAPGRDSSMPLQGLVNVNGIVYFAANNQISGTELWRSDGTAAGTHLVA